MTDALIGYGTLFQTEDIATSGVWVTTAEVSNIALPKLARDPIDRSHEHGPNEWVTALPGMMNAGQMGIGFNFIPGGAAYDDLKAELDDQDVRNRRIVFPNGLTQEFAAFLTELDPGESTPAGILTATAKFQVSGEVGPIV